MKLLKPTPWDSEDYSWLELRIYYTGAGLCVILDGLVQFCSLGLFYSDFTGFFASLWLSLG